MVDRPIVRGAALTLLLAGATSGPASAQYPAGAIVQRLPQPDDPGEKLAAALRTLAVSPTNVEALISAGQNTLLLGDPGGAIGFLGRADQIAPRDGRVKAALGSALVQLQRPADALPLFAQARALGVPDATIAEDRGLAHDLLGQTDAAQRDYRLVLAARPDDDVARRRLALSQGIAGQRGEAIATLDPLIRKRDLGAWRAQTFVLAMTGDAKGANDITRVMLPQQQAALQPFLVRLAALTPAQKARAVHFGEMPTAGGYPRTQIATATPAPPARPAVQAYVPPPRAAPAAVATASPAPSVVAPPVAASSAPSATTSDLAPASAPSSTPAAAPVSVAAASAPKAARTPGEKRSTAHPAIVSVTTTAPDGTQRTVRYARRTRDWHETFAFSSPGYEYVPLYSLTDRAAKRSAPAASVAAAATPATPASGSTTAISPPASTAVATSANPPLAPVTASAASDTLAMAGPAPTAPAPSPASPPTTSAIPAASTASDLAPAPAVSAGLPMGASASVGHYDVPHAAPLLRPVKAPPPRPRAATIARSDTDDAVARSEPQSDTVKKGRDVQASVRTVSDNKKTRREERQAEAGSGKSSRVKPRAEDADDAATQTSRDSKARRSSTGKSGDAIPKGKRSTADDDTSSDDRGSTKKAGKGKGTDADAKGRKADADREQDRSATRATASAAAKVYVQVSSGANRDDLGKAWDGVRKQAPALMKGKTPSATANKASNRLLVGPFKDEDEAQAFVNKMAGKGVSGFVFKSAKGQKVEKVDTGG